MWPVPDWGWGMGLHMLGWWVLIGAGLLAAIVLISRALSTREDQGAGRR